MDPDSFHLLSSRSIVVISILFCLKMIPLSLFYLLYSNCILCKVNYFLARTDGFTEKYSCMKSQYLFQTFVYSPSIFSNEV